MLGPRAHPCSGLEACALYTRQVYVPRPSCGGGWGWWDGKKHE